jgi:hypothetical protein
MSQSLIAAPPLAFIGDENASCAPAFLFGKVRAMIPQRRFDQKLSFQDRLALFAKAAREKASLLPPGAETDELLRKARQADIAVHLKEWADSPGLQPPK